MGVLLNLTKEYFKEAIRTEDGISVEIDGKEYFIYYEDYDFVKNLCPIDEDGNMYIKKEFDFFEEPVYILCANIENTNVVEYHYITETDLKSVKNKVIEDGLKPFIHSDYDNIDDIFRLLNVVYNSPLYDYYFDFDREITLFDRDEKSTMYDSENNRGIYIFDNEENVNSFAKQCTVDDLEIDYSDSMSVKSVKLFIKTCGESWVNKDSIEEFYKESEKSYVDDIESESGEHGNRLFDELIEWGIIEDTSEFFEIASDNEDSDYPELDYDSPKFDIDTKKDEFCDKYVESISDSIIDVYLSDCGSLNSDLYDLEKLAELIIKVDGRASRISSYDGKEYTCEFDGVKYFLYLL